jgi:hypothetical protein
VRNELTQEIAMHRYASFDEAIGYLANDYKRGCLWSILCLGPDAFYVFRSQATQGGLAGIEPASHTVSVDTAKFGRFSPYYSGDDGPGRHAEELLIENFDACIRHWREWLSGVQTGKVRHAADSFWPPRIEIINSHTPCIPHVMTDILNENDQKPSAARTIRGLIYPEGCAFKLATLRASVPKESLWSLSWFAVHKYGDVKSTTAEQWQETEIRRCLAPLGFSVGRVSETERAVAKAKKLSL